MLSVMSEFIFGKEGLSALKKKFRIRIVFFFLIFIVVGIAFNFFNTQLGDNRLDGLFIFIPVSILSFGFTYFRNVNRLITIFGTYRLSISDKFIRRDQSNLPSITLFFDEIQSIRFQRNGNIIVKGEKKSDIISIPHEVNGYADISALIYDIAPEKVVTAESFFEKYRILTTIIPISLMLIIYVSQNKIVTWISSILLAIFFIIGFNEIRLSKNISPSNKKRLYFFFWVIVFAVIFVAFEVMAGFITI